MPQEVKDCIVSGAAHVAREDESDESADVMMTKLVSLPGTIHIHLH